MNWLRNFMNGRYGIDKLSFGLLVVSMLFTLVGSYAKFAVLVYIGYLPLGLILYRMLSRNTSRRALENYKFSVLVNPALDWVKKKQHRLSEQKTFKFYKCRSCNAELRLPRGKGTIRITCPKCKSEFMGKT